MNPTDDINTPQTSNETPIASIPPEPQQVPLPPKKPRNKLVLPIVIIASFLIIPLLIGGAAFAYEVFYQALSSGKTSSTSRPSTDSAQKEVTGPVTLNGTTVDSDCFSYTAPKGYVLSPKAAKCSTEVNIPNGDSLTSVVVKANSGKKRTADEALQAMTTTVEAGGIAVQDSGILTFTDGTTGAFVHFQDSYKLLAGMYYIVSPNPKFTIDGKLIVGTTIQGYVYNKGLKAIVEDVVKSVILK